MKRVCLLLLLFSPLLTQVEARPLKQQRETMQVDIPEQQWKCAYRDSTNGQSIVEYIPKNQTLQKHSELITIQFISHSSGQYKPSSAIEFVNSLYAQSRSKYPALQWNTIKQSDYDVLYEWSLPFGYKNFPPQSEIVRIVWTTSGIHRVAYEKKSSQLDHATRELWLQRIGNAKLIQ